MNIAIKNIREDNCVCDALILPFVEDSPNPYIHLQPPVISLIKRIRKKEFSGSFNDLLLVPAPEGIKPERILFLGLGKKDELTSERLRQAGGKSLAYLRDMKMGKTALSTLILDQLKHSPVAFIEGALLGLYTYKKYKQEKDVRIISSLALIAKPSRELLLSIRNTEVIASSVAFAKDLVNAPANDMTPADLAHAAITLKKNKVSVRVFEKKDIEKIGMGAFLAVSHGSRQLPKFIMAQYRGSKTPPVVLVGKSITFDSGGLSLKPSEGMEKMKYDMAGGAAVLGVMKAASELRLPLHLICLLPATENLPGGSAVKPGDVVRSVSGKTIEIANTDAEGRLAVADAIEYAKRFKPRAIIDIATLTGACAIAFGGEVAAMMGNDRKLLDELTRAGQETYERVWELPLFDEYKEYLKSDISDIRNIGGRIGSLMSSAYFLYEFAGRSPWVHIDIAGTAWVEKDRPYTPRGASGIGVRLILNLLRRIQ